MYKKTTTTKNAHSLIEIMKCYSSLFGISQDVGKQFMLAFFKFFFLTVLEIQCYVLAFLWGFF